MTMGDPTFARPLIYRTTVLRVQVDRELDMQTDAREDISHKTWKIILIIRTDKHVDDNDDVIIVVDGDDDDDEAFASQTKALLATHLSTTQLRKFTLCTPRYK